MIKRIARSVCFITTAFLGALLSENINTLQHTVIIMVAGSIIGVCAGIGWDK